MRDGPEPILAFHEGSIEHMVGIATADASARLSLAGETAGSLGSVRIELCDTASARWHDQFVLAYGPTWKSGFRPSGGTLFDGNIGDALAWAGEHGLIQPGELSRALTLAALQGSRSAALSDQMHR